MSRLTWEEFFTIPLIGRDIGVLMLVADLELMRGPIERVAVQDGQVQFFPGWMAARVRGRKPKLVECMENPPTVVCEACDPNLQTDDAIVLGMCGIQLFKIHPQGDNLTLEKIFGRSTALC